MSETYPRVTGERIVTPRGGFNGSWQRHLACYALIAPFLGPGPVLDVGCGTGHAQLHLEPRRSMGVDLDRASLVPQKRPTVQADMRGLPFRSASFGAVACVHAVEHVPDPERVVAELSVLIPSGGTVVFVTPNRLTFGVPDEVIDPYHYIEFDAEELARLCRPFFAKVELYGIFGSPSYLALAESEKRKTTTVLRADPLRLRRLIPRRGRQVLYDFVLSHVRRDEDSPASAFTIDDFDLRSSDLDSALGRRRCVHRRRVIRLPLQRSVRPIERSSTSAWVIGLLPWLPAVLAAGFVVWTVSQFPRILQLVHLNPDSGFAPVLVSDMAQGTRGGTVLVGEASHLSAIGLLYLTRHLPLRDVIWDWAPYVTFLAALGLMAWACWQVAGPWAAAMTFAVGVCAESTVLLAVMAEGMRGNTFFADAAICAYLVLMVRHPSPATPARIAATGAIVAIAGLTVASDPLFLVAGLAPMVGAAGVVWLLVRDRRSAMLGLLTLAIAGASLGVSAVAWAAARSAGFRKTYLEGGYALPQGDQMAANARLFWGHVRTVTQSASHASLTVLVIGVAVYACFLLVQLARGTSEAEGPARAALVAYTAFWLLSAMAILAAFALSSFAAASSDTSRYVIPVFLAVAAVGPLWARRADWRRPVAAAGVTAFCLVSISARGQLFYENYPGLGILRDSSVEAVGFLESLGLTHGYGGYFTSHSLTLLSGENLHAYPVVACHAPASDALCPFFVNTRTAGYEPRPGERSFFIQGGDGTSHISPPPAAALGRPTSTRRFGTLTVSVYDYDIASKFAPPCRNPGVLLCPPAGTG